MGCLRGAMASSKTVLELGAAAEEPSVSVEPLAAGLVLIDLVPFGDALHTNIGSTIRNIQKRLRTSPC